MYATRTTEVYRKWLLRIVAPLLALAGIEPGGAAVARLPESVRSTIRRALLPAESSLRRLAFYLASRVVGPVPLAKEEKKTERGKTHEKRRSGERMPVFWLSDRYPFIPELSSGFRFPTGSGPRISFFDERDAPRPSPPAEKSPRDPEDARRICRRLLALNRALEDVPATVRRMLRMMERRKTLPPGPGRRWPVRGGFAPGYRQEQSHEVDQILYELDLLLRERRNRPPDI